MPAKPDSPPLSVVFYSPAGLAQAAAAARPSSQRGCQRGPQVAPLELHEGHAPPCPTTLILVCVEKFTLPYLTLPPSYGYSCSCLSLGLA